MGIQIRIMEKQLIFWILLSIFSTTANAKSNADEDLLCFVEGECFQSPFLEISFEESEDDCLTHCQTVSNCTWFSFDPVENSCESFSSCTNLTSINCPQCVSGESNCKPKICNKPGVCQGILL